MALAAVATATCITFAGRSALAANGDGDAQQDSRDDADGSVPTRLPPPRRWAVGVNPLAFTLGRYGGDVQRFVSPHNALVIHAHVDYASETWATIEYSRPAAVWGFGGELGWRYYTSAARMRGLFFGASILGDYDSVDYYGYRFGLPGIGVAADVGGQADLGQDIFITLGAGIQRLWTRRYPADIAPGISSVMGAGANPRLLLTLGLRIR